MYNEPIFLAPEFKERLWGGTKLNELFGYELSSDYTGECWGISGHANGPSFIKNGPLKGKTLAEAWATNRELFGGEDGDEFPLLVKILDAKKDLSVQVHPDDTYAREIEGENYGKTECWYVIDCEEGAEIIFGHHASTRRELEQMIDAGEWDDLLRTVKVKPGDFFYVPSGTIHAIGAGIQILETQQSSDITYRVYDYDRVGQDGEKRELHLKKSKEVTTVPHENPALNQEKSIENGLVREQLVKENYFTVERWELDGEVNGLSDHSYKLVSVLEGSGEVIVDGKGYLFRKGDHFLLPATVANYDLNGKATLIASHSNK